MPVCIAYKIKHSGFYMKVPVNQEELLIFVVGRPGPKYGLTVAVTRVQWRQKDQAPHEKTAPICKGMRKSPPNYDPA